MTKDKLLLKDTGLLPRKPKHLPAVRKVIENIGDLDLTEAFEKWAKENGWVNLGKYAKEWEDLAKLVNDNEVDFDELSVFQAKKLGYIKKSDIVLDKERYIKAFAHTHKAKYVDGKLTDECDKCGLDIRDEIHLRG